MEKLVINGNKPLNGEVYISGAKNSAVAIIPATVLIAGKCTLKNLPHISDVIKYVDILEELGAKIIWENKNTITIDTSNINNFEAISDNVSKFRASYYLLGAFLSRFNHAKVGLPGGCSLGERPIDQHLKGFEALSAKVFVSDYVEAKCDKLIGSRIFLDMASVGATINIMLAATTAEGTTIIENAAKEPHIVDVANFLNTFGAKISGAGTSQIKIQGVSNFKNAGTYSIVPDQIETGTFMIAASKCGNVNIKNCIPKHMECLSAKLREMGVKVTEFSDSIKIESPENLKSSSIITAPYPGFPTDMQSQFGVLLTISKGSGKIIENIWDSRFRYIEELKKMGANVSISGNTATFTGVDHLNGAKIHATDLRAGAALLIAGVFAEGITEIDNLSHIDRGYEDIEGKFRSLGADIKRINVEDNND